MPARTPEELKEYMREQYKVALGPDNMWFAGEFFGHTPSPSEALDYFVNSKAALRFEQEYKARQKEGQL